LSKEPDILCYWGVLGLKLTTFSRERKLTAADLILIFHSYLSILRLETLALFKGGVRVFALIYDFL